MTPDSQAHGPDKKTLAGVRTPRIRIPSNVSTPKSISEVDKYLPKPTEDERNDKGRQYPSPYLGPNAISLVKLLIKDSKRAQKRRRRRERRERKKKRHKVITKYPSIHIPSFPLPPIEQLRRKFAVTEEARLVKSNPKNAFVHLTNMIVRAQKKNINNVYR